MQKKKENLKNRLKEILLEQQPTLSSYAWPSESNRWSEFVFCVLSRLHVGEMLVLRQSVDILLTAGLLDVDTLAAVSPDASTAFVYILTNHGWTESSASKALKILSAIARNVEGNFQGKLQVVVRQFATNMRRELVNALTVPGLDRRDLEYAVSHWMQNAFSLPVSLEHEAVHKFCKREKASLGELLKAADELDLNVALLDDVLEAHGHVVEVHQQRPRSSRRKEA